MLTLKALNWRIDEDLNAQPGRFAVEFVESGSTAHTPGESTALSGHNHVQIDVSIDGRTERLMDGVVREWGFREWPDGEISTAEGLDLRADLLDFHPASPVEYRGMQVLSASNAPVPAGAIKVIRLGSNSVGEDVNAAFFQTFQRVAKDVVERAGFTADFDCRDYDLGSDIVWETGQAANDVLVTLAAPFLATERFKLDITIEGSVVTFTERGRTAPPVVTVAYDKLLDRRVREFSYPAFNDVQVRGTTYRFIEPDQGDFIVEGFPRTAAYAITYRVLDKEAASAQDIDSPEVTELQDIVVAETNGVKYYGKDGNLTRHIASKDWSFYILRHPDTGNFLSLEPMVKREDTVETWEYNGPHGETTRHVRTVFVEDATTYKSVDDAGDVTTRGTSNIAQYTEREETRTEYDSDGNAIYELSKTYRAVLPEPEDTDQSPRGLVLDRAVEIFKHWSRGQRFRTVTTRNYDRNNQAFPTSTSVLTDVATGKGRPNDTVFWKQTPNGIVGLWEAGNITTLPPAAIATGQGGRHVGVAQASAGPDDAQIDFEFPTVGNPDDLEYFRQKIKTERNSKRYEAALTMVPNLNVRTRQDLAISGAPPRWERSQFFVVARHPSHMPKALTMSVMGLAWVD